MIKMLHTQKLAPPDAELLIGTIQKKFTEHSNDDVGDISRLAAPSEVK